MANPADADLAPVNTQDFVSFARVDLAGVQIVIPAGQVLHAMARPASLTPLPRSQGAIEGVFSWGDQAVPVVDLRRWLDEHFNVTEVLPYLVLLGDGDRRIGLAASAVVGMLRVPADNVHDIHRDGADDSFFHTVVQSDEPGKLFSMLDAQLLMSTALSWAQSADLKEATDQLSVAQAGTDADQRSRAYAMVRIGASVLAIEASFATEVLVMPKIDNVLSLTDKLRGLTRWRGGSLAVIDSTGLLGMQRSADDTGLLLVLSDGSRWAGLPVDEIIAVRRIADSAIDPAVLVASRLASMYRGSHLQDDLSRGLVLACEAVLAECPLADIFDGDAHGGARMSAGTDRRGDGEGAVAGAGVSDSHIVFSAGTTWAINIRQVKEIIPVPDSFKVADDRERELVGTCDWRGKYLPVMVLSDSAADQLLQKRMIVTEYGGRFLGILVDDIVELLPPHAGHLLGFTPPFGQRLSMLAVKSASGQQTYRLFDLATLAFYRKA